MEYFILYIIGAVITAGAIGGVRDEMEGIGDMACILFWPIALLVYVVFHVLLFLYNIGKFFKK